MGMTFDGVKTDYGVATVAVSALGAGTTAVTFAESFYSTPQIMVIADEADEADGATWAVSGSPAATKTGFTIAITGSNLISRDIRVRWYAHAKQKG